jgi:hypothetical protein
MAGRDKGGGAGGAASGYDTPDSIFARAMGLEHASAAAASASADKASRGSTGGRLSRALACLLPGRNDPDLDLDPYGEDDDATWTPRTGSSLAKEHRAEEARTESPASRRAVTWLDGNVTEDELAVSGMGVGASGGSALGEAARRTAKLKPGVVSADFRVSHHKT